MSVLEGFYQELKNEWVETGHGQDINDFEHNGPKIVLILDNASIHKRQDILESIKTKMPNLILEFLPEYSPDYNLAELVWHSAKEFISNRLFESIEALEALVNKLLNQGDLIINWERSIKNKGNAINAI